MKKRDIWIICAVLAVAVAGMAAVRFLSPKNAAGTSRIYIGGEVYKTVSLDEDQVVEIDQGSGVVNHVEVKDGSIYMMDSTCSDKLCVDQGKMSLADYESRILRNWIVCLPNQITVELVLDGEGQS